MQKQYYWEHGTTLAGLMSRHQVDPEHFLAAVHDIDYSPVAHAPELVAALAALSKRKIVFTNGSRRHAEQVLARLGLAGAFDAIFDITDADYIPKPRDETYRRFVARPCRRRRPLGDVRGSAAEPHLRRTGSA